jgi:hypothetical protein
VGGVCTVSKDLYILTRAAGTRDPILLSNFIADVVESEQGRYEKAKKVEALGEKKIKKVVTNSGEVIDVEVENGVDNNVSNIAMNIIKSAKILNEILNPPKAVPFNQTNIQNNFGSVAADEIRNLSDTEKKKALSFIDEKLDVRRKN